MTIQIRPYQSEGLEFLVNRGRAALFDEMGLGKSMQALLSMRDLEPRGKILVVATGDSIGVWQDEIPFWLGEEPTVFAGLKADRAAFDNPHGFVITNYHRLAVALAETRWDGVIFDEAQALRNRNTRTLFKTVRNYFDKGRYGLHRVPLMLLTGSPVVKHVGDVWPLLHLIDKQEWSSYWKFVGRYANVWQDQYGWHIEGVGNLKKLRAELSQVALWRTVKEVQPNLPPKHRQRIRLVMTPKQAKAYREVEREMMTERPDGSYLLTPTVLARETRLRQILACPRLVGIPDDGAALAALAERASTNPEPIVVYTPFPEVFPYAAAALDKVGRPIYTARGGTGARFKEGIELFKLSARAGEAPILFCSVFMGKGWSVAETTHRCYNLQWDWNNTTQDQAEARLHRDGQQDTVFSGYFCHEDTHDFNGLDVLAGKRRLADAIFGRLAPARRRLS